MNLSDRATARTLLNALETTGANMPKIAASYSHATKISDAGHLLGIPQDALALAVSAALEDDRDPGDDPEVRRIVTTNAFANPGIAQAVDAQAFGGFRAVCRHNLDAIVKALRTPFDVAAATLAEAHSRIGDVPLEDTGTIMRKGTDVAEVWAKATAAVKVIEAAEAGWQALGTITGASAGDPRYRVLRIASVDFATWTEREFEGMKLSPWDATRAGLSLSLPTVSEYRQRVAIITAGRAGVAHQDERARNASLTNRRIEDVNP